MDKKYDVLILFSGGADSVLLLEMAVAIGKKVYAVIIDYEQLHRSEIDKAIEILLARGIEHQKVKIEGLNINSGLTGNGIKGQYEGVSCYNVPGRNTLFLSIALSIAEANNIDEIWYGPDMSDYYGKFPDCYQSYVAKVNELFEIAGSKPIKVFAPLLGFTKELVLETLDKAHGVKKETLYSGYGEYA